MDIYYIAFRNDQVIAYGTSPDGAYPEPNDKVEVFAMVDALNEALAPYGYYYSGE